tara:strand:+ start:160 stop:546 length:387 start_codon:yes stop_codon:yes gene_type:complete
MIAIETKYLGPTSTKGSRVKATTCNGHSITVSYDDGLTEAAAHLVAVVALIGKYKFNGRQGFWDLQTMRYGSTRDGYVWVMSNSKVAPVAVKAATGDECEGTLTCGNHIIQGTQAFSRVDVEDWTDRA